MKKQALFIWIACVCIIAVFTIDHIIANDIHTKLTGSKKADIIEKAGSYVNISNKAIEVFQNSAMYYEIYSDDFMIKMDISGALIEYSYDKDAEVNGTMPVIARIEAQKIAEEFTDRINSLDEKFRFTVSDRVMYSNRPVYSFFLDVAYNEIPISMNLDSGYIEVDHFTGDIRSCYINRELFSKNDYPGTNNIISAQKAYDEYVKNGLTYDLVYAIDKQKNTEQPEAHLFYRPSLDLSVHFIDAKTGRLFSKTNLYANEQNISTLHETADISLQNENGIFTPRGQTAIPKGKNTLNELEKAAREIKNTVLSDQYSLYSFDYDENRDVVQLYFQIEGANIFTVFGIHAATGKLVNIFSSIQKENGKPEYDQAFMTAKAFLVENGLEAALYKHENRGNSIVFRFEQLINGIPFADNSCLVIINADGAVSGYSYANNNHATFDSRSKIMSIDNNLIELELFYCFSFPVTNADDSSKDIKPMLMYRAKNYNLPVLDAKTGKPYDLYDTYSYMPAKEQNLQETPPIT